MKFRAFILFEVGVLFFGNSVAGNPFVQKNYIGINVAGMRPLIGSHPEQTSFLNRDNWFAPRGISYLHVAGKYSLKANIGILRKEWSAIIVDGGSEGTLSGVDVMIGFNRNLYLNKTIITAGAGLYYLQANRKGVSNSIAGPNEFNFNSFCAGVNPTLGVSRPIGKHILVSLEAGAYMGYNGQFNTPLVFWGLTDLSFNPVQSLSVYWGF
ncbi:MAG: hypothetical protein GC181_12500 [Bacteroidetes bacterium]|nr:hypothetical protein [Bacteroidota bacterium]